MIATIRLLDKETIKRVEREMAEASSKAVGRPMPKIGVGSDKYAPQRFLAASARNATPVRTPAMAVLSAVTSRSSQPV